MTAGARIAHWIAIGALSFATAAMFVVSLRSNYLYGYGIGQTDEKRLLFAWANVAADIWKAFGLVAITLLWRASHRRIAILASIAWLVCLLSGINSAIGIYVHDRTILTGERRAKYIDYRDAERELAEIEARRNHLSSVRSLGEIDALIAATLAQPVIANERIRGTVGKLSSGCHAPDARTTEACTVLARLRIERAGAEEAARLQLRTGELRREIVRLRERDGTFTPDPVGEFYAWATRGLLSVRDVGFGFPLFFALMIEIVTAFGPVAVARFAEVSVTSTATSKSVAISRDTTGHVATRSVAVTMSDRLEERVATWMAARATPCTDGGVTTLAALHHDFTVWCSAENLPRCDASAFAATFDRLRTMPELAGKIRKFGTTYYGIGLGGKDDAKS